MKPMLWSTDNLAAAMGARRFGALPDGVTGISIDTRTVQPGEAFFAIKGDRFDGHDFVTQAMKAGATLAVVAESRLVSMGRSGLPFLVVDDVLEALRRLARAARARSRAQIIAVTGSVGKTTTKEMLRVALAGSGKAHASAASFNNHWGVPLTLAAMPQDTRYGVFEIGMNHAGEITPLVGMVRPNVAIITTIAPAHLGAFASIDDIARAKAEIFSGVVEGGTALLYRDNAQFGLLETLARETGVSAVQTFGSSPECEYRLLSARQRPDGTSVTASLEGEEISYELNAPGGHIVANSLAVLAAARLAGADMASAVAGLASFSAGKGRGERHVLKTTLGPLTIIDESYNANSASMEAALKLLAAASPAPGGRRIAILGDMRELGEHSARLHRELKEPLLASGADRVYLAGPEMAALAAELEAPLLAGHFASAKELAEALGDGVRGGDVVMLKASKSLGFSMLVEQLLDAHKPKPAAR